MSQNPMHDLQNLETATLSIEHNTFSPNEIWVRSGSVIKVVNNDDLNHSVTDEKGRFDLEIEAGEVEEFYPPSKGTFTFYCKFHPDMKGKLKVY